MTVPSWMFGTESKCEHTESFSRITGRFSRVRAVGLFITTGKIRKKHGRTKRHNAKSSKIAFFAILSLESLLTAGRCEKVIIRIYIQMIAGCLYEY